jgi:hypothetical protein
MLLYASFIKLDNPLMRAYWTALSLGHQQVVRSLLEQASEREEHRFEAQMNNGH